MAKRLGVLLCSCIAGLTCLQVGLSAPASAASSWSVVPLSISAHRSSLGGISCGASSFCVATGETRGKGANALYRPLIEHWNGATWSQMQSPAGTVNVHLGAVSCTSATFCMLVGNTQGPSGLTPLTEQWDGKHWKVVPNAAEGEFASAISCVGSSFSAVVGSSEVGSGLLTTFGEVWDGTSWTSTPTPNPGIRGAGLDGVSCVAPTSCVAVGGASGNGSSAQYPSLALDWNGSTWSQFASQNGPDPGGYNVLAGVSCHATLSSCTAVGWYTPPGGTDQTLIESWTSTGWTIVPSPEAPGGSNDLESVSCPLASFCVATGITASEGEVIEEWDGSTWSVSPGADVPGSSQDFLFGVSCTHKVCFAAGTYGSNPGKVAHHALLISRHLG